MNISGIVLAGGESRRFGKPKAFTLYDGIPFYERSCQALEPHVNDLVIVGKPEWGSFTNRKVIYDTESFQGLGPLAGIYSAMKIGSADWYFVLACDMPLVDAETVGQLLKGIKHSKSDAIVPWVDERFQPLAAVYHRRTFDKLKELLKEEKLKVRDFLSLIDVQVLHGLNATSFQNVNTKEDLERVNKEAGS